MFIIHLIFFYLLGFQGFWIVHDEIESLYKQAIINAAKFLLHDGEIDVIGGVATKTAEAVAAIVLYLGISSIIKNLLVAVVVLLRRLLMYRL